MWIAHSSPMHDIGEYMTIVWEWMCRDSSTKIGYVANVSCLIHDTAMVDWETSDRLAEDILRKIFVH